ncbi:MAG: ATP-binding protein [Lentisphaerae bacterium]|nr:ATP-binding protein [Lentisphaerota bacterium]MBT5611656.1 ATP-binding protein [Lentisphaerota bacterium]
MIGKKADALWMAYVTASTPGEKQDIMIVLNVLAMKHLHASYDSDSILLPPPPKKTADGTYCLGTVVYNGKEKHPFGLREEEWIQHVGIFGRSGAGKTNLALNIIRSLLLHKKPILLFDWKRNYRDLLTLFPKEKIVVYTVGRDVQPIQFNPLIPPAGTRPETWLKKLIEIIATTYYVGEGVISLLLKAIDTVYKEAGVYTGRPTDWPTMLDILAWLRAYPAKGREGNWMASTLRAVEALCYGEMGRIVNVKKQPPISDLLQQNVVLELDSLTSSDKTFFIESLLLWIYHFRMAEGGREEFKHVILIEEAHHILTRQEASRKEGITDIILREIRELGESIMLLDQLPSQITPTALANTHTTFTFNLKNRGCVATAAGYTLIGNDDKDSFGRLPVGQAIVKLQGRWFQPFLVKIPHIRIRKGSVSDAMLRQLDMDCSIHSSPCESPHASSETIPPSPTDEKEETVSAEYSEFIQDVLNNPLIGVSQRYGRLGISRRRGNQLKSELIARGFFRDVSVPLASGRTVLLAPTERVDQLISTGKLKKGVALGACGLAHEFWKKRVRASYERRGFAVEEESPVAGGAVDLVASQRERRIAIEIETGKSNIEENIRKTAGFAEVVLVATNPKAHRKINGILGKDSSAGVSRITVRTWREFC